MVFEGPEELSSSFKPEPVPPLGCGGGGEGFMLAFGGGAGGARPTFGGGGGGRWLEGGAGGGLGGGAGGGSGGGGACGACETCGACGACEVCRTCGACGPCRACGTRLPGGGFRGGNASPALNVDDGPSTTDGSKFPFITEKLLLKELLISLFKLYSLKLDLLKLGEFCEEPKSLQIKIVNMFFRN